MQEVSAVYIHIPFCNNICSYCDFCKFYYNKKWILSYLEALDSEIKSKYQGEIIKTLYIGGGTPSSLSCDELEKLFDIIKIFNLDDSYEFTIECNINDLNEELIKLFSLNKVNRISIGVESFDKDNLLFLNRSANYDDVKAKIDLLHKYNINNINLDLMYALPNESIDVLKKDLELFTSLDINHISTYSLMIENNTMLANKNIKPINEDLDYEMYETICEFLEKKGFIHYEVSNFAKEGYFSQHNLVYWNNLNYYGFGCGASGYVKNVRYDNTRNLNNYLKGDYLLNEEHLNEKDIMDYEIILGFRKCEGININRFKEKYNKDILEVYNLQKEIDNNNLIVKNGNIFINMDKLYIMNEILTNIL